MKEPQWVVSPMTADDLADVYNIEQQSPSPWSMNQLEGDFFSTNGLRLVCRPTGENRPVAFFLGRIVGEEAEVLKISTARKHRRQGAAIALLRAAIQRFRQDKVHYCHLELRSGNQPGRRLYEKFDFQVTGLRKNYYTGPDDDALCMTLTLHEE